MSSSMSSGITIIITYKQKNKVYNIEIDPDAKVSDLIQEFTQIIQLSPNEQISLKHEGEVLSPNKTFSEQHVRKGSNLELLTTVLGG